MHWTWDPAKAAANKRKHGVSFDLAAHALADPLAVTFLDPCPDEERWRTVCMPATAPTVVLFVIHTWPDDDLGRIISARDASPAERKAYEEG